MRKKQQGKKSPALAILVLVSLFAGCADFQKQRGRYPSNPRNPYKTISKIAIPEFINLTDELTFDVMQAANLMASELVQFGGFEVVRPVVLRALAKQHQITLKQTGDYRTLAKAAGADAVLVVGVMAYDPYPPRQIVLHLELIPTSRILSTQVIDIQDLIQYGSPLTLTRSEAEMGVRFVEEVVNVSSETTAVEIRGYARQHEIQRTGLREDAFFLIEESFIRFASNKALQSLLALEAPGSVNK